MPAEYITVALFCREYNVAKSTAYSAIARGDLPAVPTGASKGYRIRREDAERYMGREAPHGAVRGD